MHIIQLIIFFIYPIRLKCVSTYLFTFSEKKKNAPLIGIATLKKKLIQLRTIVEGVKISEHVYIEDGKGKHFLC